MFVRANTSIAKIFSSIVPKAYRDVTFAKRCTHQALSIHPSCSKANHRMAILKLTENVSKKKKDTKICLISNCMCEKNKFQNIGEAISFCEKAIQSDERNSYAIIDLIKMYLSDTARYGTELSALFNKFTDHPFYLRDEKANSEFLYLEALLHFFNNQSDAGIRFLIESYKKNPNISRLFKVGNK